MPNIISENKSPSGSIAPLVLTILDGWGFREESSFNAIRSAETPIMDALWDAYPHTLIEASGAFVGLPDSQMGNSEVGHLTIGAGRVIKQELVRISETVRQGKLEKVPALKNLSKTLQESGGTLHVIGLCSDGGVHSHLDHLSGLLRWAKASQIKKVSIHAITDGRDTPTRTAKNFLETIQKTIDQYEIGEIASLCGRYWAMDRDQRWERTLKAYDLLTNPEFLITESSPEVILTNSYENNITDEFLEPVRLTSSYLKDQDGLIMFNFRPDRARQIMQALTVEEFEHFPRQVFPKLNIVTFTQYEADLPVEVAFPPETLDNLLGQIISENGLKQYRTAETEKYPHVTYFLNGGIEKPLQGEDRHLVPSPRVATYDLSPSMSAEELTKSCKAAIETGIYSLIVINYANPDMVGHTGVMDAAKEAITTVDTCIGKLLESISRMGGTMLITADHGNAELMQDSDGQAWTAHTTNPVPVIIIEGEKRKLVGYGNSFHLREGGGLADIAPTILHLLDLPQPEAMTGNSLIEKIGAGNLSSMVPQVV